MNNNFLNISKIVNSCLSNLCLAEHFSKSNNFKAIKVLLLKQFLLEKKLWNICQTVRLKMHTQQNNNLLYYNLKEIKNQHKFFKIVTVIISNEIKRALFQYIGKQPMKCKKIRVDPVSIQKVEDDINVKSKKIKNTNDDPIVY